MNKILNLYILALALFVCNVVSGDVSPDDIMFRKPEKEKIAESVAVSATTNVEQSLVAKVSQAEEEVKLLEDRNAKAEAEIKALKEKLAEEKVTDNAGNVIYQHKVTRIPACCRCGDPEQVLEGMMAPDYTCPKCASALLRRNTYLNYTPEA